MRDPGANPYDYGYRALSLCVGTISANKTLPGDFEGSVANQRRRAIIFRSVALCVSDRASVGAIVSV
jgi:hypothetical protein